MDIKIVIYDIYKLYKAPGTINGYFYFNRDSGFYRFGYATY